MGLMISGAVNIAQAQGVVPGTGQKLTQVGDDFEDTKWAYYPNFPKSSSNIDKRVRAPEGRSSNGRTYGSDYRGTPDIVRRVPTPAGGLEGSKGALLLQSMETGIPGRPSYKMQQDDFMFPIGSRLGYQLHPSWNPSAVVRVYLPEWDKWDQKTGSSFGFRISCRTTIPDKDAKKRRFSLFRKRRNPMKVEPYWPGFFIQFNSKTDPKFDRDFAALIIRCDNNGQDVVAKQILNPGWWTLGMSVSGDGKVHYYAKEGIEDLTAADHIMSSWPYGFKAEKMSSFFFNIVSRDDNKHWSTPWIIDDAAAFIKR